MGISIKSNNDIHLIFGYGERGSHKIITACFIVVTGDVLRVTKEYNLTYVPETREWFGDVIAYGQWWDLDPKEVTQLRSKYDLDSLMRDYLMNKMKR